MKTDKLNKLRMLKERVLSTQDPLYFLSNYVTVPSHGEQVPWEMYKDQIKYISTLAEGKDVICKASRRSGATFSSLMYILWYALHHEERNIIIMTNTHEQSCENIRTIRSMFESLPDVAKGDIDEYYGGNQKVTCSFTNGTRIISGTQPFIARGMSVALLYIDNFELFDVDTQEETWCCLYPCILAGGRIMLSSTSPGPSSKKFGDMFKEAVAGENRFTPIVMNYNDLIRL